MAHETHIDLPDDFDALLRQTMAVEPSAEFLPGVRRRIAAEPRRSSWWGVALVAGSAVAALVLVPWPRQRSPQVIVPPAPRVAISQMAEPTVPVIDSVPKPPVASRLPARSSPRVPASVVASQVEAAPLVIVDERQRTALAALMRLVGEGQLTDDAFAQTTPPSMDAIRGQVIPVDVARVDVSPIVVGAVLPVGPERN